LICVNVANAETIDIKSYPLSNNNFDSDCSIVTNGQSSPAYAGELTLISCPGDQRYDVYLTEMLRNTTIPKIVNEIQEEDDNIDEKELLIEDERDWIRHLYRDGLTDIVLAKKSNELSMRFKDSILVVFLNITADDPLNTYSVVQYRKHFSGWIEEFHAFDFVAFGGLADFYLFDDYALYLTADRENVQAIYFEKVGEKWEGLF
jgi:hypothetical protein